MSDNSVNNKRIAKNSIFNPLLFTQYRSALMGVSIIWIFLFHSKNVGIPVYDSIQQFGWAGVDIFFFLSALGLSFSLEKDNDSFAFYKRRATRILPTWLTTLFCVHLCGLLFNKYLPSLPFNAPHTLSQCICWYTGIGFFISDFVPNPLCYYYEWYVPSLLFFYAITPLLHKQKTKVLAIIFIATIFISYLLSYFSLLSNLRLFYLRFPAFIIGIFVYRIIKHKWKYYPYALFGSFSLGLIGCFLLYGLGINIPKYFVFQQLMPAACILLIILTKYLRLVHLLNFFGGISLELYLIHIYKRPQYLMSLIFENKLLIVISTFVLCTIAAISLHEIIKLISPKIIKSNQHSIQ